jgi:hypothetical protein
MENIGLAIGANGLVAGRCGLVQFADNFMQMSWPTRRTTHSRPSDRGIARTDAGNDDSGLSGCPLALVHV